MPGVSCHSSTSASLAAATTLANMPVPVGKSQYSTAGARVTRLCSLAHSRIWSHTFVGTAAPGVFRVCGCACCRRYRTICSAEMPPDNAASTLSRVTIPTYRFGNL